MKKVLLRIYVSVLFMGFVTQASAQTDSSKKWPSGHNWDSDKNLGERPYTKGADLLPLIRVEGNRFVNSKGDTILFHGVAVADPDNLEQRGRWSKDLIFEAKKFGADIVRLPVHPAAWRDRTPEKYLRLLDQAIDWCTEESLYVDIDWHSIGNLEEGIFQNSVYNTSLPETLNFWATIASRYRGHHTVAFLELFNEPTDASGRLGNVSWDKWKEINEVIIKMIRSYNNQSIPLIAGFDWAYDLTPLHLAPVNAEGVGYSVHPYPHKRTPPYEPKWDEDFGFAAAKYPIVATEFGFTSPNADANLDYGKRVINYFEKNHISWICWILDPLWGPPLLQSWKDFKLDDAGVFFEKAAHGEITPRDTLSTN